MPPAIAERLSKLEELHLESGGHSDFDQGVCFNEAIAWIAGEPHSDSPKCVSPFLRSFTMRLNDGLDDENRQKLKPFLARCIGTAGDGKDELRGYIAADWLVHTAMPTWLEISGATEAAAELRALPVVSGASIADARPLLRKIRDEAWERRTAARKKLTEKITAELERRGLIAAAVADADAAAAAAADAAAAAVAVAVAAAVADAVADAAAVAAKYKRWGAVYDAVKAKLKPIYEEKYAAHREPLIASGLELLDKLIDPEPSPAA
jgi:hypothetical protein